MSTDPIDLAYVVKGFWAIAHKDAVEKAVITLCGEIELQQYLVDMTDDLQWAWEDLVQQEFDAVWAYEVAEPFGEWIALHLQTHGEVPTHEQAREYLRQQLKGQ
jgi:hypothetical protein